MALLVTASGAQAQFAAITVDKTATPTSLPEPGGTFTFNVSITNSPAAAEAAQITSLTDDVYGDLSTQGTCTTAVGTSLAPGASYSCSFPGAFTGNAGATQTDTVTAAGYGALALQATSDTDDATVTIDDVPPTVTIDKSASPTSRPEPGGTFTFSILVTNTSAEPVTITSLTDNVYGDLSTRGTCTTAVGTSLAANGGTYSCSFDGLFNGNAGASQTDTATVVVSDDETGSGQDTDDATITLTNVPPTINVTKTAEPGSQVEPGGTFTFNVAVQNTSFEPVTITAMVDDVYGNLNGRGTCATGGTIAPNTVYSCSFTGSFTGEGGDSQTDVVSVTVVDDDSSAVTDTDDATVFLSERPDTTIVGNTGQNNSQTSTTSQSITQNQGSGGGGGVVVGSPTQNGQNQSTTGLNNGQGVGESDGSADSNVIGDSGQNNTQSATTDQDVGQAQGPGSNGVIVGDATQNGQNQSTTDLNNDQGVGGTGGAADSNVVGDSGQTNKQSADTDQDVDQGRGPQSSGVLVGSPTQNSQNQSTQTQNNRQAVGRSGLSLASLAGRSARRLAAALKSDGRSAAASVTAKAKAKAKAKRKAKAKKKAKAKRKARRARR